MANITSVLVTGAAGFIGSHLSEALLKRGYRVFGIDNYDSYYAPERKQANLLVLKGFPLFTFLQGSYGDFRTLAKLKGESIRVVFHLGARPGTRPSVKEPALYRSNNVEETERMLSFLKKLVPFAHYIFASSSSVYGKKQDLPFEEKQALAPLNPYGETKLRGEKIFHTFAQNNPGRVRVLRLFSVYGPRQRPDLAFCKFSESLFSGQTISIFGKDTYRDFTYVEDVVNGILLSMDHVMNQGSPYEVFNIGSGRRILVTETVHLLMGLLGLSAPIQILDPLAEEGEGTFANIDKANSQLGYQPQFSFEKGIANFVQWFLSNRTQTPLLSPRQSHQAPEGLFP